MPKQTSSVKSAFWSSLSLPGESREGLDRFDAPHVTESTDLSNLDWVNTVDEVI